MAKRMIKDESAILDVSNAVRSIVGVSYESVFSAAYLILLIKKDGGKASDYSELKRSLEIAEEIDLFLRRYLDIETIWPDLVDRSKTLNKESLENTILFLVDQNAQRFGGANSTPDCICKLVSKILNIQNGEKIADICCGVGSFLTYASNEYDISVYGSEINTESAIFSKIRMQVLGNEADINLCNALDVDPAKIGADKAFSNYPWGIRLDDNMKTMELIKRVSEVPEFQNCRDVEWIFNYALLHSTKKGGISVGIMSNGRTSDGSSNSVRKMFVEKGLIKALISLPANLFPGTSIPSTMIVMGHGNTDVMFVNASELFEQGRRKNTISDEDIDRIVKACSEESSISKLVSKKDIAANDYNLSPAKIFAEEIAVESGVPFGDVIKNIRRGAQLKAQELDAFASNEKTPYQYLMLSNISDGLVDVDLPYLSSMDEKLEKFCLKNGDLIISKIGSPTKVAVAEVEDGKKIIANGNLFIVELDTKKANPYYIKAFLESPKGQALIERVQVGVVMKSISVEQIRNIQIPLVPLEKQNDLATLYQSKIDSLRIQKKRYEKTLKEIGSIYELWEEGV